MNIGYLVVSPDPYDFWATKIGIAVREKYYQGDILGKTGAIAIGMMDWLLPELSRKLFNVKLLRYPIVIGHTISQLALEEALKGTVAKKALAQIVSVSANPAGGNGLAWGLGFPWMSKNGLYPPSLPFITHTPYVMEALLALSKEDATQQKAMDMFFQTWLFLEKLNVMYQKQDQLALSYAPVNEPRIVLNANSYAAFSYALHSVYGQENIRKEAAGKARKIACFVTHRINENGSWHYYADNEAGNFIDCFHSCFIIKNLLKTVKLLPELEKEILPVVNKGWKFIRDNFYDDSSGLCRRFIERDIKDPFKLDLYDQAEYLGLLIDFNMKHEAEAFAGQVESTFKKGDNWYCRIDIFGRCWGKNFMRWGIVPFQYQRCRLKHL